MKHSAFWLAVCLAASTALCEDLTWQDLARRPELWPTQCAVKAELKFEGGATVRAGQKVDVLGFKGNEVELKTTDGTVNFSAAPDETDVLSVARKGFEQLTPKQRELTYPLLAQRRQLWPEHVTLTRAFDLGRGQKVQPGDELVLEAVQPDRLVVHSDKLKSRFSVVPQATDVMAQARKTVESKDGVSERYLAEQRKATEVKAVAEKKQMQGRVVTELEGKLINAATGQADPLETNSLPRYFVFLRGSTTCPITRGFTPKLTKFYRDMKPRHPEFEVVYLTVDSVEDTEKFAKEFGFSWRAITYENTTMPSVNRYIDGKLPQLLVMDREGQVLANGIQATAPAALQQLDTLLNQPASHN